MTPAPNGPVKEANTMFRKLMTITAVASMVVLSACSSSTGPDAGANLRRAGTDPGPKPPQQFEKVCLEELRAVEITSPGEADTPYAGQTVLVTWEAREICGHFEAELEVSLDDGRTFESQGQFKNATSASWKVPGVRSTPILRVTLRDSIGELSDEMAFGRNIILPVHARRIRPPQNDLPE